MNLWLWMAAIMLLSLVPCVIVTFRGEPGDRLVGLEAASALLVLEMVLLAEGFGRSIFYDLPLTLALLAFGGGLVFARFMERWL